MKKLIVFIILIINILPCISQTGYPKEVILSKDTLLAFTYNQVREINKGLEEGEGCKVVLLETEKLNLKYDSLLTDGVKLVNNLKAQINGYEQIIDFQNQKFDTKEKQYNKLLKKQKTTKTITGVIIGTLIGGLVGVTIWGATK